MNARIPRLIGFVCLLIMQLCAARMILAQDQKTLEVDPNAAFEGRVVNKVDFAVRPSEDVDQLRALVEQKQGKPFSIDAVKASVAALRKTGKSKKVQVSVQFTS